MRARFALRGSVSFLKLELVSLTYVLLLAQRLLLSVPVVPLSAIYFVRLRSSCYQLSSLQASQ
eukprot:2035-Heterococcus_DN1.PRE.4